MFLGNAEWREMIEGFRRTWQARLDTATEDNPRTIVDAAGGVAI